ncbi:MAG TPA: hypothetical protein VEI94_04320 [Candidatus Bathyarchaeia archaeon]|nr:hypothetical protein [Candidatus Bathyarchaeia archaeon]
MFRLLLLLVCLTVTACARDRGGASDRGSATVTGALPGPPGEVVPPVHVAGMPPDVESPSNHPASEAQRRVSRRQVRDFLDAMADGGAADPVGSAPEPDAPPGVNPSAPSAPSAAKLDALAAALAAGGSFGGGQAPTRTDEVARRRFGEALRNAMGARNSPPAQDDPGGDP